VEGVRCPTIVGRADELAVLRSAVDGVGRGRGAVRILVGEAGVGKSRLAADLAGYAADAGLRVLRTLAGRNDEPALDIDGDPGVGTPITAARAVF
jgi:hypothetical protein